MQIQHLAFDHMTLCAAFILLVPHDLRAAALCVSLAFKLIYTTRRHKHQDDFHIYEKRNDDDISYNVGGVHLH